MTRPIGDLDVSLPVVEADIRLHQLLAAPPAGHTAQLQPAAWYEQVFDLLACTHPDTCKCPSEEAS
jgi:hypothetical protein